MYVSSEGIVLKQVKAASGRRMVQILTPEYGLISAGSGLNERNAKSKSALAIRPFTYSRFELYRGRNYYDINSGEVIRSFYELGENIDKFVSASIALELTAKCLPEEMPQPALFSELREFLGELEKRSASFETLLLAYEVKLLSDLGMMPVLDRCASCGRDEESAFSIRDGGTVCSECAEKAENKAEEVHRASLIYRPGFGIVNVLKYFNRKPISAFQKVALDVDTAEELQTIIRGYIAYHLDVGTLKSESML